MDTAAYIQQQLKSRFEKPVVVPRPQVPRPLAAQSIVPEKERSGFMQKFLGICILFMAVATFAALIAKGMGYDIREALVMHNTQPVVTTQPRTEVVERPIVSPDYMSRSQGQAWMTSVDERLDKMDENYKIWRHRLWLMALANNENANLSRSIDQRYHGNTDSGFITFDDAWKMNRMPRTMQLTPEQQQELQRDIK